MWFIIFTREGAIKVLRIIKSPKKEQRELKSYYLSSGNIRKTLTPKIIEKIWSRPSDEYVRLSELPMDIIKTLKREGYLVRWYEI